MHTRRRHNLLMFALLVCGQAGASGLQVAPVSLKLLANQNADGLSLSNTGAAALHAQVRVYQWTQEGGEEHLTPSRGLLVSPPMLQIEAENTQLVRVIRIGAPPSGASAKEAAYRIVIDELPTDAHSKGGLNFVLRYSVPVFVEPAGIADTKPHLTWKLIQQHGNAVLDVTNDGNGHAQLSKISFTNHQGKQTVVNKGLLGYVLPGARMRWELKSPVAVFDGGGTLNARVNDEAVAQPISLDTAAR